MLKSWLQTSLVAACVLYGSSAHAQKKEDIEAIKSMCGCYEVSFNFAETFSPDKDYQFHDNYYSGGLEWVQVIEESKGKIVLQHLLIVNDSFIVKHWRQDWLYEPSTMLTYEGKRQFRNQAIKPLKGQWVQLVAQVDDSPRYAGIASWVHADGRHFWESSAYAPLPRREYTKRSDYNLMLRRNRHEIMPYGWVHEQDNQKILRSEAGDRLIAQEKGWNEYKKVADERCHLAQEWWDKHQDYWNMVRRSWEQHLSDKTAFEIAATYQDEPLYKHFFEIEKAYTAGDIDFDTARQRVEALIIAVVKPL